MAATAQYVKINAGEHESFGSQSSGSLLPSASPKPLAPVNWKKWFDFASATARRPFSRPTKCCIFCRLLPIPSIVLLIVAAVYAASLFSTVFKFLAFNGLQKDLPLHYNAGWPGSHAVNLTKDIKPIPCHSHNDYWRETPLFDALRHGCTGVEADVWLFEGDEKLYVGHDTASLSPGRTFEILYVNPILELVNLQNPSSIAITERGPRGIFEQDSFQTLVLLVDFKTSGSELLAYVEAQLEPLRSNDYLTYFNGTSIIHRPVTIVGTGNAPFDMMTTNTSRRDIFFDAPLGDMHNSRTLTSEQSRASPIMSRSSNNQGQGHTGTEGLDPSTYDPSNSFYASTSFMRSIGYPWWFGTFSDHQLDLVRAQIRGAHERGLQARFWSTPSWPKGVRNYVWSVLLDEGADILNADDLDEARNVLFARQRTEDVSHSRE